MPAFQFRLARVLSWYQKRRQLEEDRLRVIAGDIGRVESEAIRIREARNAVDLGIAGSNSVTAAELCALHGYREGSRKEELALEQKRVVLESSLIQQRIRVKDLHTRIRLLEKLRERRRAEHVALEQRELEDLAADAFRAASFRSGNELR
jgi:hypothetical protein